MPPVFLLFTLSSAFAGVIETNSVVIPQAPQWLKATRVEKIVDRVQSKLQWDIRRARVNWYADQAVFQKAHGYDSSVLAFARREDQSIHIGPQVSSSNFDAVFAHELVHLILYQKFKNSIPSWLDEGLANYFAKHGKVDYRWLAAQPQKPLEKLGHPFKNSTGIDSRYHYMVSTAVIEMIASKCDLEDLLQLALNRGLMKYLATTCEIRDLNFEFGRWLQKKKNSS